MKVRIYATSFSIIYTMLFCLNSIKPYWTYTNNYRKLSCISQALDCNQLWKKPLFLLSHLLLLYIFISPLPKRLTEKWELTYRDWKLDRNRILWWCNIDHLQKQIRTVHGHRADWGFCQYLESIEFLQQDKRAGHKNPLHRWRSPVETYSPKHKYFISITAQRKINPSTKYFQPRFKKMKRKIKWDADDYLLNEILR